MPIHALDLITKATTGIANRSDDLLATVNEYLDAQWRDLGITGEQALGLLTQGLQGAGARDSGHRGGCARRAEHPEEGQVRGRGPEDLWG